jgi:hypothetical protein
MRYLYARIYSTQLKNGRFFITNVVFPVPGELKAQTKIIPFHDSMRHSGPTNALAMLNLQSLRTNSLQRCARWQGLHLLVLAFFI